MRSLRITVVSLATMAVLNVLSQGWGVGTRRMCASVNNIEKASLGTYQSETGKLLISWRMLPTDSWDTSFYIYWRTAMQNGTLTRLNDTPIKNATCYQTEIPTSVRIFYLVPTEYFGGGTVPARISNKAAKLAMRNAAIDSLRVEGNTSLPYISIPLKDTEDVYDTSVLVYQANDVSVGDLDGDGQMEIVVKRLQCQRDANGNVINDGGIGASYSYKDCLYAVIWDAYKLDGTFLWRIKGGPGVILGNSSSFAIADFDGDGCAEMAIRTCEGTVFGDGQVIPDTNGDGKIDYRTWYNVNSSSPGWIDHYNSAGPEFISIIDGRTGKELARDNFIDRATSESWGDGYWKRACSFRIGVGCFDETGLPSVVLGRGVYARSVLEAWDWRNGQLTRRWHFDSSASGSGKDGNPNSAYAAQGNHSFNVADLDGDGYDEVMYGSMAIDHDGIGLWTTKMGHGDANHVGKFLPERAGLQMYHCLEHGKTMVALHDAADGSVIWSKVSNVDNDMGRCMVADINPSSPGCEFWWYGNEVYSQDGVDLGYTCSSCNMGIWFDGTLSRQLYNENIIHSPANGRTFTMFRYDMSYVNGSKGNPSWYGDLVGDWREEVIVPDATKLKDLKVFTTWYNTKYKFPYLMSDHTYMMQCLNQNIGYNQPTNLGYFLGTGMNMDDVPLTPTGIKEQKSVSHAEAEKKVYDLTGREVRAPRSGIYIQGGRKVLYRK